MFCSHSYGWPRRVDAADIQICTRCGAIKRSKIQFPSSVVRRSRRIWLLLAIVPVLIILLGVYLSIIWGDMNQ